VATRRQQAERGEHRLVPLRVVEDVSRTERRFEQGDLGRLATKIAGCAARAADVVDGEVPRGGEEKGPRVDQLLRIRRIFPCFG
jgi:hypothetical protein